MYKCKICETSFKEICDKGYKHHCSHNCYMKEYRKNNPEKCKTADSDWRIKIKKDGKCLICGFTRALDLCHIVWAKDGGKLTKDNTILLCPNHHRLFDRNELTKEERNKL